MDVKDYIFEGDSDDVFVELTTDTQIDCFEQEAVFTLVDPADGSGLFVAGQYMPTGTWAIRVWLIDEEKPLGPLWSTCVRVYPNHHHYKNRMVITAPSSCAVNPIEV